ncbi:hypothetical protein HYZ97_00980 [Candidatus Pacearchaeota archaeon]|nr:hypothetical protein [Candidatus Pacearchaeota archaeon]
MSCAKHRQQELEQQLVGQHIPTSEEIELKEKDITAKQQYLISLGVDRYAPIELGEDVTEQAKPKRKTKIRWDYPTVKAWNIVVVDQTVRPFRIYRSIDLDIPEAFCANCYAKVKINTPIRINTLWGKNYNGKCQCGFGVST